MKFVHEGYHSDGSMCVYGYSDGGVKVAIFKGYPNLRRDTVKLYPRTVFVSGENTGKQEVALRSIK